ncbi:uncharacterized protein BDZ99DRAFT_525851 [Mytilinidion resinicola]|uniref:Uncharacterized protein n=1 Tax=Mytilinidion resinicola TaxID=574789 RepID=A0A6A6Y614_9PEZI|nr:uncharacterized protein BDZ99DRAFT_525851 [Mytilinidion resinicola]KAF2804256.1 hypothetical protein BDZ99DRAFT_525851 [Mytilinidion resinicola]
MSPPTLTTIPSELRHQILRETLSLRIHWYGWYAVTPFTGVCKQFEADIAETLKSWLPTEETDVLVTCEAALEQLKSARKHFHQLAADSKRSWSSESLRTVRINALLPKFEDWNSLPGYVFKGMMELVRRLEDTHAKLTKFPYKLKHVKLDLTIPPEPLHIFENCWDGREHTFGGHFDHGWKYQKIVWTYVLERLRGWDNVRSKCKNGKQQYFFKRSRLGVEIVGTLPPSQLEVVAYGIDCETFEWLRGDTAAHQDAATQGSPTFLQKFLKEAIEIRGATDYMDTRGSMRASLMIKRREQWAQIRAEEEEEEG